MSIINKRLLELRKESSENQDALADVSGFSRSTVSNYENGNRLPTLEFIIAAAKHYGVSTDYLIGLTNERNSPKDTMTNRLQALDRIIPGDCPQRITMDTFTQLVTALINYYGAGAPAGDLPVEIITGFLSSLSQTLTSLSEGNVGSTLYAANQATAQLLNISKLVEAAYKQTDNV